MYTKKYLSLLILSLYISTHVLGQVADATSVAPAPEASVFDSIMSWILMGVCALVVIVAGIYVIRVNRFLYEKVRALEAEKSGVKLTAAEQTFDRGDDFWTRMRKKFWEDAAPIEKEGDIMFHHSYDGIRELDNSLPPWWINMFVITVIWAVGYMWFYHFGGDGLSSGQAYEQEVETAKKEIAKALAGKMNAVDESSVVAMTEKQDLDQGAYIFKSSCANCHGQLGEGLIGPNFTDEYWIHGGGIKNVFKTVKYGVPEKGMIAWQSQLKAVDIQRVASYILTLKGTNPPNPKDPQGTVWSETATAQDTTITAK